MVSKVDGNNYYVYETLKKMNIANTGEEFSLNHERDGLQAESKGKNGVSGQEKQPAAEQSGVRIELSGQGMEKQRQAEAAEHPTESGLTSLLETIRTFFTVATAAVKDIFDKIWNNPLSEDSLKDNSGLTETADIADALKSTETEGVIEDMAGTEMTDAIGAMENKAARNSTLLTFYDRNGKVVKLDASVQQRTLYGDRNSQKL